MTVDRQLITKARNAIAHEALIKDFDYLFFVDDDNPIPEDTLEIFLKDDKDIVVAPILSRTPPHTLCSFYAQEHPLKQGSVRLYEPIGEFRDPGPLHRVDAGGTGCMLIKRRVLETLNEKHKGYIFEFGDVRLGEEIEVHGSKYDRRTMSEDCEFCERAVDSGFEIWLDDRVVPAHITGLKMVKWSKEAPAVSG
jgi:hypothetical protein